MDFRYVDAFVAVMRHGSFSAAASELNIAVSAVSRQIKLLEESVGQPLFARTTRSTIPTPAGEKLHAQLSKMIAAIQSLEADVAKPPLRIGTLQSVFQGRVINLFRDENLVKRYAMSLKIAISKLIAAQLANGMLDIGIMADTVTHKAISKSHLYTEGFVWYGKNAKSGTLVLCEAFEESVGREFKEGNIIRVNSFSAAKLLADEGIGRTIIPLPRDAKKVDPIAEVDIVLAWNVETCNLTAKDLKAIAEKLK